MGTAILSIELVSLLVCQCVSFTVLWKLRTDRTALTLAITAQAERLAAAENKVLELQGYVSHLVTNVADLATRVQQAQDLVANLTTGVQQIRELVSVAQKTENKAKRRPHGGWVALRDEIEAE